MYANFHKRNREGNGIEIFHSLNHHITIIILNIVSIILYIFAYREFSINAPIYIYIFYINEITNFEFSGKWNKTDAAVKISRVCREKQSFVNCHRDRWCKSSFKRGVKSKKSRPRKRRNKKKKKNKNPFAQSNQEQVKIIW